MKKKVLILFPEGNLPYSPTTLNLILFAKELFDVYVLSEPFAKECEIEISNFTLSVIEVDYKRFRKYNIKTKFNKLVGKLTGKPQQQGSFVEKEKFRIIKENIRTVNPDIIIAIDLFALHCCQQLDKPCIFLSLEIPSSSSYLQALAFKKIKGVIIQSEIRYKRLFEKSGHTPRFFILPNSPVFVSPDKRTQPSKNLVYNGYIWSAFGPQFCLHLITGYPEYKLYLKGNEHPENLLEVYFPFLKQLDQLSLDTRYLNHQELKDYLQNCSIGFCFYHFEHPFIRENAFNYETGPSGKLYAYLGVGLPVICSNIQAFKFVEEAKAGILINDYSPGSLKKAVEDILNNYKFYSDNALKLAEQSCFKKNIEPIFKFLLQ